MNPSQSFAERLGTEGNSVCSGIRVMHELWRADRPTFRFKDAYMRPKPVNRSVPIVIGGHSTFAAKRASRLGDDFFPARGAPAELVKLVRDTAVAHGRDPDAIEITTGLPESLDDLPQLAAAGIDRVLVPVVLVIRRFVQNTLSGQGHFIGRFLTSD